MEDSSIVDLYLARDERAICETDGKYGKKLYSISRRIDRPLPQKYAAEAHGACRRTHQRA